MRKLILVIVLFTATKGLLHAQTDLSVSPFALLVPALVATLEIPVANNVGLEGYVLAAEGGGVVNLNARYYLTPKRGHDGFNIGMFVGGGTDLGVGPGFSFGYKTVSERGVLFDVGFGLGRSLSDEFGGPLPYAKLNFGYRFQSRN
jgi:hypothetical protein